MGFAAMSGVSRLYNLAIATSFLLLSASGATASSVSILFVGNSLTQANDLPMLLKRFAGGSSSRTEVEVRSITPGGALLVDHWKRAQAVALLHEQRLNFLILQGQSTEPLFAPQSFTYYGALFKAEAEKVQTTTIFLSTWARPAGDAFYKEPTSGGSPTEMQTRLNDAYARLAHDLNAKLAPVGVAFERAHHDAPAIELLDGTQHPSFAGSYLAAAVLYRVLFDLPANSSYFGELPASTAITLQQIANDIPLN